MAWALELNGHDISEYVAACQIRRPFNERATATLTLLHGLYTERDDTVVVFDKDGVTPLFGGLVLTRGVKGAEPRNAEQDRTVVECVDWLAYLDWITVTLSYDTEVALEDVVSDMVTQALAQYGLTYTPTATGKTLAKFSWRRKRASAAARELRSRTGLALRAMPDKSLVLRAPGAMPAPFAITDATTHCYDLEWRDSPRERFNKVTIDFGPNGPGPATKEWVADGVETSWVLDIPALIPPVVVEVDDGVTPYLATVGVHPDGGGQFDFEMPDTLHLGIDALPAAGTILRVGRSAHFGGVEPYVAQFPFTVTRDSGASPVREHTDVMADVTEYGPAVEITEQTLAALDQPSAKDLTITTDVDGFDADQALTVNTTVRGGLVGLFLLTLVDVTLVLLDHWEYTLKASETSEYQGSTLDEWRQLTGGSGGVGSVGALVVGGGAGAAGGRWMIPFGGARSRATVTPGSFVDLVDFVPFVAPFSGTARVRTDLWARNVGVAVTLEVYDDTAEAALTPTSTAVEATSPTATQFLVTLTEGHRCHMRIKGSVSGEGVYASGTVEQV